MMHVPNNDENKDENIDPTKGEKHEAAATDDDTSNGTDRESDKDNEDKSGEDKVVKGNAEVGNDE